MWGIHFLENVGSAGAPSYRLTSGASHPFSGHRFSLTDARPGMGDVDGDGDLDVLLLAHDYQDGAVYRFFRATRPANPNTTTITVTVNTQVEDPTADDDAIRGLPGADVIAGLDGDDFLQGLEGDDRLIGDAGDDDLRGGAGADTMRGGAGDDFYSVENPGDIVVELADEGVDTVQSLITCTLTAHVEHLILGAGGRTIDGTGNGLDNTLTGNDFANVLRGEDGADALNGRGQDDVLHGGDGADRLDGGQGADRLQGDAGEDVLLGGLGHDRLDGGAGVDRMEGGAGNDVYVVDEAGDLVIEAAGAGIDTVEASIGFVLGDHVENLLLTGAEDVGGVGNGLRNIMTGNGGGNLLRGGDEVDTLRGGSGDDTLHGDTGGDFLHGGDDDDALYGGEGIDSLYGDAGDDRLAGGAGADRLHGGAAPTGSCSPTTMRPPASSSGTRFSTSTSPRATSST